MRAAAANSSESWDEKAIARLRSRGYAPFNAYPVDFFLALPDEAACRASAPASSRGVQRGREAARERPRVHFSLHATKTMRLIVPDMQELGGADRDRRGVSRPL